MKILLWGIGFIILFAIVASSLFIYKMHNVLKTGGKIVEWSDTDGTTYKDLRYGIGSRNTYDLVIPTDTEPTAVMIFVHGGSWNAGQKEDMAYEAHRYAKQGYATATINYTRIGTDSLDYESKYEKSCFPTMIEEIYNAVAAIKTKGTELGYDFKQMAIGGYSAGGHLAMLYATQHATTSPIPIKFHISWVGPSDMNLIFPIEEGSIEKLMQSHDEKSNKQQSEMRYFIQYIAGDAPDMDSLSTEQAVSLLGLGSPLRYITAATSPAVLVYGANDGLVVAEHGKRVSEKLEQYGINNSLFIFPNSGHELGHDAEYTDLVNNEISRFCELYFE